MKITKRQIPKEKKLFSNKRLVILVAAVAVMMISGLALSRVFIQTPEVKFSFKAAIIDHLGSSFPNPTFIENATSILQNSNFTVVYNSSREVTVDFYRNLPKSNCGIVLFRVHSAIRNNTQLVDLFTSEHFQDSINEDIATSA